MAIDTPARLAILGAGPIGLEAALYARFLGYDVILYERGEVAEAVRQWGHLRMSAPFGSSRSTLGLAAIQAQDERYQSPAEDAVLTCGEWHEQYLLPLSRTDLIADHLRLKTTVVAVGKEEPPEEDRAGNPDRGDWPFRVLSRGADGREQVELFDGVLDCTGVQAPLPEGPQIQFELPEPNFYVLGSKGAAAGSTFLFRDGLAQIRETFAILGDRATLDLYAGAGRLLR